MQLGVIRVPRGVEAADPGYIAELGQIVESAGCESLWTVEHIVVPERYDSVYPFHPSGKMGLQVGDEIPDSVAWMAFLAARTEVLKLGVGVLILPLHNPVVLAKQIATLDRLSGGRILLGVGLGWLSEEFDAIGVPFSRRGARADEYIAAMRTLWREAPASFGGEFVQFTNVHCHPQPLGGRVPLIVGGVSSAAVRRAVHRGDGIHLMRSNPDVIRSVSKLIQEECASIGRDPSEVELTMVAPASKSELRELQDLGVTRVILSLWEGDLDDVRDRIEEYQTDVFGVTRA